MIRVFLVDDQALIRRGLRSLLKPEPDLLVMGEAEHGEFALAALNSLDPMDRPDVILMDIRMPVMDGVAATGAIVSAFPSIRVLILTTFDDTEYVTRALQAGASGYLLKDTPAEELVQAIQWVNKGYTQLSPGLAQKLVQDSRASGIVESEKPLSEMPLSEMLIESGLNPIAVLTPREQEVLQLIASGSSNREIAQTLYISEKTVKNHITNLLMGLGLRDRTQAAIYYHEQVSGLKAL
ncbi:MAG: response regulator transcription factor [Cyanobacteria bacterium]|nr:response regulator transcription factor [Cyanobacteriota bacterium]